MADIGQEHVGDRIELEVVGNQCINGNLRKRNNSKQHGICIVLNYTKSCCTNGEKGSIRQRKFLVMYGLHGKLLGAETNGKKKTETAKNNRNSEVAGPGTGVTKHTAGSRSIIEHTLKLDIMTARIAEETQADIEGEEPLTLSHDAINDIYYDVVGGMKKNCVYVLASQAKVVFPHAMSTSTGKGRLSSSSVEIQELKKENADLRARFTELEEKMREFMARMVFSQTLENPSAFPDFSSPIIDSDETQAP
ncbi:uncharacterized protein [Henckelia pumila]|uniref:uncharacterized protein isoform X2 n=1 Tax=Henckelia pumila TaxID=405737 RepID=UPI003C6E54E1